MSNRKHEIAYGNQDEIHFLESILRGKSFKRDASGKDVRKKVMDATQIERLIKNYIQHTKRRTNWGTVDKEVTIKFLRSKGYVYEETPITAHQETFEAVLLL